MARRRRTEALHLPQRSTISLDADTWPRSYQRPLLAALLGHRFDRFMAVWHRGAGKDYTTLYATVILMLQRPGNYYFVYPEAAQGRRMLWDGLDEQGRPFLDIFPPELVVEKNETEMMIRFKPVGTHTAGATWQLIGADDPDRHRGMNPAGIVFSEWPHIPESMYTKIAEPRLLTNQGWAVFIFTPEGKNHAHTMWKMAQGQPRTWFTQVLTVDDTKKDAPGEAGTPVVSAAQIQALRAAGRAEEIIQQEYFCSFEGFLRGTVYGDVITTARKEGRIGAFPYRADLRVHTAWDIGLSDGTAIWFYQTDGRRFTFIDFLFERGKGLHHFAHVVQVRRPGETGRPYVYGDHTGPHDLEIVEYSSQRGQTRREVARELGLDFRVAPKLLVAEGIDMARRLFSRCYFHETTCGAGLDHLGAYHYAWEERKQEYGKEPVHDEHSHAADAFRTFAVCPTEHNEGRDYRPPQRYAQSTWDPHGAGVSGRR